MQPVRALSAEPLKASDRRHRDIRHIVDHNVCDLFRLDVDPGVTHRHRHRRVAGLHKLKSPHCEANAAPASTGINRDPAASGVGYAAWRDRALVFEYQACTALPQNRRFDTLEILFGPQRLRPVVVYTGP